MGAEQLHLGLAARPGVSRYQKAARVLGVQYAVPHIGCRGRAVLGRREVERGVTVLGVPRPVVADVRVNRAPVVATLVDVRVDGEAGPRPIAVERFGMVRS